MWDSIYKNLQITTGVSVQRVDHDERSQPEDNRGGSDRYEQKIGAEKVRTGHGDPALQGEIDRGKHGKEDKTAAGTIGGETSKDFGRYCAWRPLCHAQPTRSHSQLGSGKNNALRYGSEIKQVCEKKLLKMSHSGKL